MGTSKGGPQSESQRKAAANNFNIKRLRGIAANARYIEMPLYARNRILMGVDQALEFLGADSEALHRKKQLEKLQEELDEIANNPNP